MENITLNYKNIGKYSAEDSSRYEAIINNIVKVRIVKDNYFEKGFTFSFITINGYHLDVLNGDFHSNFWSKASKKDCIKRVSEIINDVDIMQKINNHANYIENNMVEFISKQSTGDKLHTI
jgi:hypothetical protein